MSNKRLVAYFSASGMTASAAKKLASVAQADLFEIKPEVPYTQMDLNWMDKNARSTIEMQDGSSRPAIREKLETMNQYDVVFVGFPIWWYVAPTIINTFLESYDMSGKTIIPFATSGGSGLGKTVERLKTSCSSSVAWKDGKLLNGRITDEVLKAWIETLNI